MSRISRINHFLFHICVILPISNIVVRSALFPSMLLLFFSLDELPYLKHAFNSPIGITSHSPSLPHLSPSLPHNSPSLLHNSPITPPSLPHISPSFSPHCHASLPAHNSPLLAAPALYADWWPRAGRSRQWASPGYLCAGPELAPFKLRVGLTSRFYFSSDSRAWFSLGVIKRPPWNANSLCI